MCPEVCSGWTSQLLKKSWTTWGYTRPRVINCQWTGAGDSPLHCKTNCRYKYKSDTQLNNQFTATTGNLIFHSGTTKKTYPPGIRILWIAQAGKDCSAKTSECWWVYFRIANEMSPNTFSQGIWGSVELDSSRYCEEAFLPCFLRCLLSSL